MIGPVVAITAVRNSTQQERTQLEEVLLGQVAQVQQIEFREFDVRFSLDQANYGIDAKQNPKQWDQLEKVKHELRGSQLQNPPLSWKLDEAQKRAIGLAWQLTTQGPLIEELRQALNE